PSYRSGDLVRILKNGEIEFHGRTDNQVKLRGLRVELGEIESVLNSCPGVITSIVQVIHGETDYLGAWYTADREIGADELKERLSERLTSYMVPQAYMQLQEMPLTANGKIDKKALPKLNGGESRRSFKQPETELQEKLCELFKKALGLSVIGIDEDFFELGGTSLAAAKVLMGAMVQDIPVEYQDIFDARTVEKLEQRLLGRKSTSVEHYSSVIIQEGAKRFDEEDVRGILSHNTTEYVDDIRHGDIGNVLLTGATGFLGIHVLKELMDNSGGNIICLVRGRHGASGNVSAESRLRMMLYYYFNRDYAELFGNRLTVREVDITDRESLAELLNESFDTVINCAASVKHFADYDSLKTVNVDGVQNLIELCLKKKARLIQTSTVSVSGEALDGAVTADSLKEDNLNIGQDTESNAYVHTKYIAEECVLKAVAEKGLDAKIMRLGNLMSRHEDSEFQINFRTSSFMSTLKAYAYLGCCPYSAMDEQTDFSPIDETARGIIALSGTSSDFTVFHVFNSHMVDMGDVFRAMVNCGIHLDMVSDDEFEERIRGELAEGKMSLEIAPLISYRLGDDDLRQDIPCDNRFTVQALYRLGFRWSITDERYLEHTVSMLQTLGFFDV
ncbi:MAG: SDR family oxidoreductase, partial [Lachnospiraceae bacterium]|nr:SDR family oxidoreductase [Lachnospiraceae bacterium]